jgi:hypothetical protein
MLSLTYQGQLNIASWNKAVIALNSGVAKLRLNAEKFGITENSQFVNVDRVILGGMDACLLSGRLCNRDCCMKSCISANVSVHNRGLAA